jgi:hypothetical protein
MGTEDDFGLGALGPTLERPLDPRHDLLVEQWINRRLPERDYLLGNTICSTSRWLMFGETGIGKTLFAMGMAGAISAGLPFLNWIGRRPARVMYIDGELPAETFKERMQLVAKSYGHAVPFYGYSREILGPDEMPPLNVEAGQKWLFKEIEIVKPDVNLLRQHHVLVDWLHVGRRGLGADETARPGPLRETDRASLAPPHGTRQWPQLRHQDARMGDGHRRRNVQRRRGRPRHADQARVPQGEATDARNRRSVRGARDPLHG